MLQAFRRRPIRSLLGVFYLGLILYWVRDAARVRASYETEAVGQAAVDFFAIFPPAEERFGRILEVRFEVPWQRSLLKSGPMKDVELEVPMGIRYQVRGERASGSLFLYILSDPQAVGTWKVLGCGPESADFCEGR